MGLDSRRGHFLSWSAQDFQALAELDAALVRCVADILVKVLAALAQLCAQLFA